MRAFSAEGGFVHFQWSVMMAFAFCRFASLLPGAIKSGGKGAFLWNEGDDLQGLSCFTGKMK
jgi:hypothetical protein